MKLDTALFEAISGISNSNINSLLELANEKTPIYFIDSERDKQVAIKELKKYLTELVDFYDSLEIDLLNYIELPASNRIIIVHAILKTKIKNQENKSEYLLIFTLFQEKINNLIKLKIRNISGYDDKQKSSVNMQNLMELQFDLTKREAQIAQLLYTGMSTVQVANKFKRSESTVKTQLKSIYKKMDITSRQELIKKCLSFTELC